MRLKLFRYLIAFCLLLTLGGCSGSGRLLTGAVETNTNTSWSIKYSRFSGQDAKTITVHEGSPVEVFVSITTESGRLDLTIIGKDGTSSYEGKRLQTVDFSVTIEKPGDYDIAVTADKHSGGFKFTWE